MKPLTKPCLECGQTIIKPRVESLTAWHSRHKFCSRECSNIYRRKHPIIPRSAFKKGHTPAHKGTKGLIKPNSGSFKKGHTPWMKGKKHTDETKVKISENSYWKGRFGSNSPNWKEGRVPLRKLIRNSVMYKNWRSSIFKRDNYTCVLCFRKRKAGDRVILEVDHYPTTFSDILDNEHIKGIYGAYQSKLLWDTKNGRTLCRECHKSKTFYPLT